MRRKKEKSRVLVALLVVFAIVLGVVAGVVLTQLILGRNSGRTQPESRPGSVSTPGVASQSGVGEEDPFANIVPRAYNALPLPDEMRGTWIVFLEWQKVDWSTAETARAGIAEIFQNCADLGLNTVMCHVRPFGDALYKSALYPWSHLLTGSQGQDPGYDPLAIMVEEAHSRGLRIEAMINPYRVKHEKHGPETLSADNPATQHPEWVLAHGSNLMYDPGRPEVEELVALGVLEIVQNYDVDGIHFDDYFYPEGIDDSFDAASYAEHGGGSDKAGWRRANVSRMVQRVYSTVKAANPSASFGISPAGNNENNYQKYYADVNTWLASEGYVDYIMPQIYWGFGWQDANGKTYASFNEKCAEWGGYPRHQSVRLYAGIAAYRIGFLKEDGTRGEFGGNGSGNQDEWSSGHALADLVQHTRTAEGFSGFALYRYEALFQPNDPASAAEVAALKALM